MTTCVRPRADDVEAEIATGDLWKAKRARAARASFSDTARSVAADKCHPFRPWHRKRHRTEDQALIAAQRHGIEADQPTVSRQSVRWQFHRDRRHDPDPPPRGVPLVCGIVQRAIRGMIGASGATLRTPLLGIEENLALGAIGTLRSSGLVTPRLALALLLARATVFWLIPWRLANALRLSLRQAQGRLD